MSRDTLAGIVRFAAGASLPLPSLLLPMLLLLPSVAPAQMQQVVPGAAAIEDQPAASFFPFTFDATRTQQLWDGAQVTANVALIMKIAYRQEAKLDAYPGRAIPSLTLSLGHSALTPATMSTTFANNASGPMTVVASGPFNLPSLPPVNGFAPFTVAFPLTTPFPYVRAQGNLLLEVLAPGYATQRVPYMLDAVRTTPTDLTEMFGKSGAIGGSPFTLTVNPSPTTLAFLSILFSTGPAPQSAHMLIGASTSWASGILLPFDLGLLGAPGNLLYVSPQVVLPMNLTTIGAGIYQMTFNLPRPGLLPGSVIYGQGLLIEPSVNALGVVTSQGWTLQLAGGTPITQTVVTSNTGLPTGLFAAGNGTQLGPVVEFTGTFQ